MTASHSFRRLACAIALFVGAVVVSGCQLPCSICGDGEKCKGPLANRKDPVTGKLKGPFDGKLKGPTIPVIPPVVPPAPVPPSQSALGVSPGAPPPGPPTVFDKLGLGAQQREFRLRQLSQTPAGMLLGGIVSPISKLTAGVIPPLFPATPTLQELLAPGPIGAASKIKMDNLNAEKRKQAVEELADVDCHYWPEAEEALIAALRTDRNERVRYTAATVLQEGKCCTNKTIEALIISSTGSDRDGAPCETSAVVRAEAAKALEHCMKCMCQNPCGRPECEPGIVVPPMEEKPREEPREPDRSVSPASAKPGPLPEPESEEAAQKMQMKVYYDKVRKMRREVVLAAGQDTLTKVRPAGGTSSPDGAPAAEQAGTPAQAPTALSPRPQGIFDHPPGQPPPRSDSAGTPAVKPGASMAATRPKNVFDLITGTQRLAPTGTTPAPPEPTREPPLAPIPTPMPPQALPAVSPASAGARPPVGGQGPNPSSNPPTVLP